MMQVPQYRAAQKICSALTSTRVMRFGLFWRSDDKYYARVKALRIINEALGKALRYFTREQVLVVDSWCWLG